MQAVKSDLKSPLTCYLITLTSLFNILKGASLPYTDIIELIIYRNQALLHLLTLGICAAHAPWHVD